MPQMKYACEISVTQQFAVSQFVRYALEQFNPGNSPNSLVSFVALESGRKIAYNEVDTNSMLYIGGVKDIQQLLEKFNGSLVLLRNKAGLIDNIPEVRDYMKGCERLLYLEEYGAWKC